MMNVRMTEWSRKEEKDRKEEKGNTRFRSLNFETVDRAYDEKPIKVYHD